MTPGSQSLDSEFGEFVLANRKVRCATCKLDPKTKAWVEDKLRAGASAQSLASFLGTKQFQISASALINHKNAGYHES